MKSMLFLPLNCALPCNYSYLAQCNRRVSTFGWASSKLYSIATITLCNNTWPLVANILIAHAYASTKNRERTRKSEPERPRLNGDEVIKSWLSCRWWSDLLPLLLLILLIFYSYSRTLSEDYEKYRFFNYNNLMHFFHFFDGINYLRKSRMSS